MSKTHVLDSFLPAVRQWFRETFGEPTAPQTQGWPAIQRGEHTLILAPTGSGKTLAAFLCEIDNLFRERELENIGGVRLLYLSPLKALNNDVERNLRVPLEGISAVARRLTQPVPELSVAVRTGDTPSAARQRMARRPPQILITTPESLYLMLTSSRTRAIFRTVRTVIVDEIHTLTGDKRGVHLSLSLERLADLAEQPIQRIGLSATIKPLDEVARFLGGQEWVTDAGETQPVLRERPVTIVDTGYRKAMDLQVVTAVEDFASMPGNTVWPSVVPGVLKDILTHRSTLIFTNNRRLAERTADRLNAQLEAEQSEEIPPGSTEALAPGGIPRDAGMFTIGASGPFRAHHGSMSKEARHEMEEDLKLGKLPALVGTSSLELGIDIGAVDLVVQLQSPKSVAQGLQRVGRSGHLVGQTSVGRIYATYREDLVEAAALARAMLDGDVEQTLTPQSPLDVLSQQIVAMVAVADCSADALLALVRRAYAYRDLTRSTFDLVLEMLSGKYHAAGANLRARIAWDRINDKLSALPGSRLLAMSNAGTIADHGAFGVYLSDGKTRIGELDEEFVFETRTGNTFLLGSQTWKVLDIRDDRIIVGDASGSMVRMPFWRGDYPWRTYSLGLRIGRFRRELIERIFSAPPGDLTVRDWLRDDYRLDENSINNIIAHVQSQLNATGTMSNDRQVVLEVTEDALGARIWVLHSPFGGRVNGAWALALVSALRERVGVEPEVQTNDDGILFRFPRLEHDAPAALVRELSADQARERILRGLPNSALFGAHFRMNAGRALLLPRALGAKRTPFWLQRLKAKDLLAVVRRLDDFPIIAETYRDCLRDVLDLPHLEEVLNSIQQGTIEVVQVESLTPSPIATGLLANFQGVYMYEWDEPKTDRQAQGVSIRRDVLEELLGQTISALTAVLKPEAMRELSARAQHVEPGWKARSLDELAQILFDIGDLTTKEVIERSGRDGAAWLAQLHFEHRVSEQVIPTASGSQSRWVHAELAAEYRLAFAGDQDAAQNVLRRYLRYCGPVTFEAIRARYGFAVEWLQTMLGGLIAAHEIARGCFTPDVDADEYCDLRFLEQVHQRSLTLRRKEVKAVSFAAYADFLLRWQHVHAATRASGENAAAQILEQLRGLALPAVAWERDVLPARLASDFSGDLAQLLGNGGVSWVASGREARRAHLRFLGRGEGGLFVSGPNSDGLSATAAAVYEFLRSEGASFGEDIESATGLTQASATAALVECVLAGLVTNDALSTLRAILEYERPEARSLGSSLEAELAIRRTQPARLTPTRMRVAKQRVRARLEPETQVPSWGGRWSLVHRTALMGKPLTNTQRAERLARLLLERYGVVARECMEIESIPLDWATLFPVWERMEMRGEIRRGYFVQGLSGLQFALPEAVESLSASAARLETGNQELPVVLSAVDPANLFGLPDSSVAGAPGGPKFARVPSTHVVVDGGQLLLVAEDNGARMSFADGAGDAEVTAGLRAYLARPNAPHQTVIEAWNGQALSAQNGEPLLSVLGFSRSPKGMERWSHGN